MAVVNRPAIPSPPPRTVNRDIHAELVARAHRWLRSRCTISFPELVTIAMENPDGWGYGGDGSILVECKATRADFLADRKKFFRRNPAHGMGNLRYFLCPPDLIQPVELPEKWGLLYCMPKTIKVVVKAMPQDCNLMAERTLLASVVRRCALRWPIHEIQDVGTMPGKRA